MEIIYDGRFPSDENPEEVKKTEAFGLAYAQAIWNSANESSFSYNFESDYGKIARNRKFARGQHSVEEFKPYAFPEQDKKEFVTVNYLVTTPLPKMLRVMEENIMGHPFKPRVKPYDSYVKNKYEEEKNKIYGKMILANDIRQMVNDGLVPDTMLVDDLVANSPKDIEEAEIALENSFQILESIALEKVIRGTWVRNGGKRIERQIATDIVENNRIVLYANMDENYQFKVEYIDIPNFISSYCVNDDFSDATHMGHIVYYSVGKFRELAGGRLTDQEVFEIAKNNIGNRMNSAGSFNFGNIRYFNDLDQSQRRALQSVMIKCMRFEVLTSDRVAYREKKVEGTDDIYFEKRSSTYTTPKSNATVVEGYKQLIYTGLWCVNSDKMLRWEQKPNQLRKIRNGQYESKPCFSYVVRMPNMLEMRNVSRCEEVIPHIERMITLSIKMQHWLAVAPPPGPVIDVSTMQNVIRGMGMGTMRPLDALTILRQTGARYVSSVKEDGSPVSNMNPADMAPSGIDNGMLMLLQLYQTELAQVKEILGVNDAVDGTQPDKRTLVGVQEISYMAHKTAIKPMQEVYLDVIREVSERAAYATQAAIKVGKITEEVKQLLSEPELKVLQMRDIGEFLFNLEIQMLPDEFEKQALKEKISFSIQQGTMQVEDAMRVERVMTENVEQAEIELRRAKKEAEKRRVQIEQEMSQIRQQEAMAIQQAQAQTEQMLADLAIQKEAQKKDLELRNLIQQEEEKRKTMVLEMDKKAELLELQANLKSDEMEKQAFLDDSPEQSAPKSPKANVVISETK